MTWNHEAINLALQGPLENKRIILGVCGSIAAYKSAELVRLLLDQGAKVKVVMTKSAHSFVQPLTFQALSGEPVRTSLWDEAAEAAMGHIELARWADAILIAPASANFIAKLAQGFADDILSTLCLATSARILIAPAMNQLMWGNAAMQSNVQTLKSRSIELIGPASGGQACGDWGLGRMSEPVDIVASTSYLLAKKLVDSKRCLITAGPTRESIDPVRYITNHSSGKMGFAIAAAAAQLGFKTTLVSGPVTLPTPVGVDRVDVQTAEEMYDATYKVMAQGVDLMIASAAVSDFKAAKFHAQKIKKSGQALSLALAQNPDIISELSREFKSCFMVGFAAESENLIVNALQKLEKKGLDIIVANDISETGLGMNVDNNKVTLIKGSDSALQSTLTLGPQPKQALGRQILVSICHLME